MKKWNAPAIEGIEISQTEHKWLGIYRDGGYIGDGEVSGHLTWDKPSPNQNQDQPFNPGGTPAVTELDS